MAACTCRGAEHASSGANATGGMTAGAGWRGNGRSQTGRRSWTRRRRALGDRHRHGRGKASHLGRAQMRVLARGKNAPRHQGSTEPGDLRVCAVTRAGSARSRPTTAPSSITIKRWSRHGRAFYFATPHHAWGSGAPTRTPTASSASTCRKGPACYPNPKPVRRHRRNPSPYSVFQ